MPEDNQQNASPDAQAPAPQPETPPATVQEPAAPAPVAVTGENYQQKVTTVPAPLTANSSIKTSNKKKTTKLAALAAGIVLLLGGSAAAYFGVVVPNQPENVLKTAISNTVQQRKVSYDGKFSYESTEEDADIKAVNVDFNGQHDAEQSDFQTSFNVTAAGAKLPVEIRGVGTSIFFKVGDLGSIKGLIQAGAPEYASLVDGVNKTIANQWVEVDETLLKEAKANCMLNTSFVLTKADVELLQKRYKEVPFAKVKSDSDDNVNGRAAIKYEIDLDDNKGAEYSKGLEELSVVKKMKECNPSLDTSPDTEGLADNDTTPVTLWVDKGSKQIVKLAGKSTKQDEDKSKFKADYEITMKYGQASVSKPEGAKPFMEVFGGLSELLGPLLMGGLTAGDTQFGGDPSELDGVSPECMRAIQAYANSGGTTPIPPSCM